MLRNSWGSAWGLGGYFWVSYESFNFREVKSIVTAFEVEPAATYDHCYQYDGTSSPTALLATRLANVFTAQHDEQLKAVSISSWDPQVAYTVKVYRQGAGATSPEEGDLIATASGTTVYAGYYIVPLPEAPMLRADERFSVVLSLRRRPC